MTEHKALFHLNEEIKTTDVISNIHNLLDDMGEDVKIELIVNGRGVKEFYKGGHYVGRVQELISKGVDVKVCLQSLRGLHIDKEELIEGVNIVPSGVAEIVRKQEEGYAYIRP